MEYYVFQVDLCKSVFSFANIKKPLATTTQPQTKQNNSHKQTKQTQKKQRESHAFQNGNKVRVLWPLQTSLVMPAFQCHSFQPDTATWCHSWWWYHTIVFPHLVSVLLPELHGHFSILLQSSSCTLLEMLRLVQGRKALLSFCYVLPH